LQPDGSPGPLETAVRHIIADDFAFGASGSLYITTHVEQTLVHLDAAGIPIVDEMALVETLSAQKIAGAAIDVFDHEPLPSEHPFRTLPNVLATPHLGYGSRSQYGTFYRDSVANVKAWILRNSGKSY
jgi:hypothetical protein